MTSDMIQVQGNFEATQEEVDAAVIAVRESIECIPTPQLLYHLELICDNVQRVMNTMFRPEKHPQSRGEWGAVAGTTFTVIVAHRRKFISMRHPLSGVNVCVFYA
jgi:hypothetical protein